MKLDEVAMKNVRSYRAMGSLCRIESFFKSAVASRAIRCVI
jgi:hypothetical protein